MSSEMLENEARLKNTSLEMESRLNDQKCLLYEPSHDLSDSLLNLARVILAIGWHILI